MEAVEKTWQEQAAEAEGVDDYDPSDDGEYIGSDDEKIFVASYAKLMWWRFLKHKMAVISAVIVILLYLIAAFAEFVAPYDPETSFVKYKLAPPSNIHIDC